MRQSIVLIFLVLFALSSCRQTEPITPSDPEINLAFTASPIDLQGIDARYAQDVPYDEYDATKFDVFLPNSASPTGLVIFIHGGGFTGGDKAFIYQSRYPDQVVELLENQVAVATINYRLIQNNDTIGVWKSLNDSRRALQYIRYIHKDLNIDKDKIVLYGTSAGGSTSLWLGANDDQKDENNADPVLRESTRVRGVALGATQSSLDIEKRWVNDVFADFDYTWEELTEVFDEQVLFNFYGVSSWDEYNSPATEDYRTKVDMLSFISSDDPEIWVENTGAVNGEPQTIGHWYHHPFHAREIKEYADAVGLPTVVKYGNPVLFSESDEEAYMDFFFRKLTE